MDAGPLPETEFTSEATISEGSAPYAGAFFPRSQKLRVQGGVFTSNVTTNIHHTALSLPSDFRMIPLGDIDLRKEIRVNYAAGSVHRGHARRCVRKLYSAKVEGRKSTMTVKLYQGDNAEEEWREDLDKLSCIRHPNFIQIYGAANSQGVHAAIFQDDLVPFREFLGLYRHSHFATVAIWTSCEFEFADASQFFQCMFQRWLYRADCQIFIHRSTGRLCTDVLEAGDVLLYWRTEYPRITASENIMIFDDPNPDTAVISALTLEQYHGICYYYLHNFRHFFPSAQATVRPRAIIDCSSDTCLEELIELAFIPNPNVNCQAWSTNPYNPSVSETVVGGWTRYSACDVFDVRISMYISWPWDDATWLAQANYIFGRLGITSHYEDYVFVHVIIFTLVITPTSGLAPPEGYLFVCPSEDLMVGPATFRWPVCPAYWSHDPSGNARLSTEEASKLGFPAVELKTEMSGPTWDASVYAGLRKFHQAKGFDPDSQDVAKHLGRALFHLCSEANILFAHVDDEDSDLPESGLVSGSGEDIDELNCDEPDDSIIEDEDIYQEVAEDVDVSASDLVSADKEDAGGSAHNESEDPVAYDQDILPGLKSVQESPPGHIIERDPGDALDRGHRDNERQTLVAQEEAQELSSIETGISDLGVARAQTEDLSRWERRLMLTKALLITFLAVSWLRDHLCA